MTRNFTSRDSNYIKIYPNSLVIRERQMKSQFDLKP